MQDVRSQTIAETPPSPARQESTLSRWAWRVAFALCILIMLNLSTGVFSTLTGRVGVQWSQMHLPVPIYALQIFWIAFALFFLLMMSCTWALQKYTKHLSKIGFRVMFILFFIAFVSLGGIFREWVWAANDTFLSYEIALDDEDVELSILGELSSPNAPAALLSRNGQQRIWVPPEFRDRREEAVRILTQQGYHVSETVDPGH